MGFQGTDPLESLGPQAISILSPIFSLSGADSGMLSYGFDSVPAPGTEQATQDIDPLNINNNTASSSLSPAFNAPGASATLATVDWTSLTSNNVDRCAKVTLFSPGATASIILKDFFAFDLSPYNVLAFYQTYGPGQYLLELEDSSAGSCGSGFSELAGAVMTVDGLIAGGDWDANARVLLWDGSTQTIVKDFGVADANPYDISSLYTGPAQYEVRLEAQNGEGFRMNDAVMSRSANPAVTFPTVSLRTTLHRLRTSSSARAFRSTRASVRTTSTSPSMRRPATKTTQLSFTAISATSPVTRARSMPVAISDRREAPRLRTRAAVSGSTFCGLPSTTRPVTPATTAAESSARGTPWVFAAPRRMINRTESATRNTRVHDTGRRELRLPPFFVASPGNHIFVIALRPPAPNVT